MMTEQKKPNLQKGSRIDVTFATPNTEKGFYFITDTILTEEVIGKMMTTMQACIERYMGTPSNFYYFVKNVIMHSNVLKDMDLKNIEDSSEQ